MEAAAAGKYSPGPPPLGGYTRTVTTRSDDRATTRWPSFPIQGSAAFLPPIQRPRISATEAVAVRPAAGMLPPGRMTGPPPPAPRERGGPTCAVPPAPHHNKQLDWPCVQREAGIELHASWSIYIQNISSTSSRSARRSCCRCLNGSKSFRNWTSWTTSGPMMPQRNSPPRPFPSNKRFGRSGRIDRHDLHHRNPARCPKATRRD